MDNLGVSPEEWMLVGSVILSVLAAAIPTKDDNGSMLNRVKNLLLLVADKLRKKS